MKKVIATILFFSLLSAMSATASAAVINQDSDPKTSQAEITTNIAPTYTVSIPDSVKVDFNATQTDFGSIEVTKAQIEPNMQIRVSLETGGELKNQADETKTIPYTVNDTEGVFTDVAYLTADDEATDLTINITKDDWNKAYAGSYSDTVTFTVSYEEIKAV